MANVGNANIEITADSGQAQSEVTGLMGFLRKTSGIAAGVTAGLAAFETIKGTFAGLIQNTIGANASMEQYRNTLTTVLGSAEKAGETIEWVTNFAAQTPFEIPDLIEATTRLSAYGITAQDVMTEVGDMAAVMGKPLMSAVEAVADAQTGELERLKEFGITKQMLIDQAAEMGYNEVVNAKGQITNQEQLNEALFAIMKERYAGGMEIQSQSFLGLLSNAKDSMGQMLMIMSQPLFEELKNGIAAVVPIMGAATSLIRGDAEAARAGLVDAFGEETAGKIMDVFGKIGDAVQSAKDWFTQFQPTIENVKRILAGLWPVVQVAAGAIAVAWQHVAAALPPVINFITDLAAKIVEWEGFAPLVLGIVAAFAAFKATSAIVNGVKVAMAAFQTVIWAVRNATFLLRYGMMLLNSAFLANPIAWVVALIVGLIVVFVTLYKKNEAFRALVDKVWAAIKTAFAAVIDWATVTLPAWWQSVQDGFMNMVNGVVAWFQDMGARIMAFLQPFIDFFVASWENLKLLVLGIIQVFISLITGNFEGLKLGILAIWTAIKAQALNVWNLLKTQVIDRVIALWNTVVEWFRNGKERIGEAITNAKNAVVNGFQTAKDNTIQKVKDMWNAVKEWVGKIPGKFQDMKDDVIEKVGSIDLLQMGKDIVQGLIDGIGSMISSVGKKAREIAGKVESSIKERLGIESPSRILMEVGYDTGSGFIIGMNDTMAKAVATASKFGGAVSAAVKKAVGEPDQMFSGMFAFTRNDPLWKYFSAIREDGDWLNDWATHLPKEMQQSVIGIGKSLAPMIEGMKNFDFERIMQDYLNAIIEDGDYLNDWLTWFPRNMRDMIKQFGQSMTRFEGMTFDDAIAGQKQELHTHYWQVNADEITDVASLIDVVNGIVQTVRSR